jgi:squalene-hopene/tetraprenyl-beta-curcumene cyclase
MFRGVDRLLKSYERLPGADRLRAWAVERASAWMIERFEASDGLSAILPAMANSVMALKVLGYTPEHPLMKEQLGYLDGLLLGDAGAGTLRMQPCLSPVWDTVLASYALAQAGLDPDHPALRRAASWLLGKQTRQRGDWSRRNQAPPGGWYFEHRNEFYPDVDDTCMARRCPCRFRRRRCSAASPGCSACRMRTVAGPASTATTTSSGSRRSPSPTTTR